MKGSLDLDKIVDSNNKDKDKKTKKKNVLLEPMLKKAQIVLGDKVKEVRTTKRLTDSACCLISDEKDVSGHLERLLKSAGQKIPERKPILELNPEHLLVKELIKVSDLGGGQIVGSDGSKVSEGITPAFKDLVSLLFDQAILSEGGHLDDPALFVKKLNGFLLDGLSKS
jgi:molecular chaperone HtpG